MSQRTYHRHATLYPLDKLTQARAFEERLTHLRRQAYATPDPAEFVQVPRQIQLVTSRLVALLASLSEAELLAWGSQVTLRNFGGPVS